MYQNIKYSIKSINELILLVESEIHEFCELLLKNINSDTIKAYIHNKKSIWVYLEKPKDIDTVRQITQRTWDKYVSNQNCEPMQSSDVLDHSRKTQTAN